jgi:hypothetical protein
MEKEREIVIMKISRIALTLLGLAIASQSVFAQELYVGNFATGSPGSTAIYKVTFTSPGVVGTVSSFVPSGAGLNSPNGLALDSVGNLYAADTVFNRIVKVTPGGAVSTFATGMNFPVGLAFDPTGSLYVANRDNNAISKITFSSPGVLANVSTFATGIGSPSGLTFDASGNLYVASLASSNIRKLTFSSPGVLGTSSVYASGILDAIDMTFDASGNLYATISNQNHVKKITPGGVITNFTSGGLFTPYGIEADEFGNFLVASFNGSLGNGNTVSFVSPGGTVNNLISTPMLASGLAYKPALSSASAPEPGTLALLTLGGTLILVRRRGSKG